LGKEFRKASPDATKGKPKETIKLINTSQAGRKNPPEKSRFNARTPTRKQSFGFFFGMSRKVHTASSKNARRKQGKDKSTLPANKNLTQTKEEEVQLNAGKTS